MFLFLSQHSYTPTKINVKKFWDGNCQENLYTTKYIFFQLYSVIMYFVLTCQAGLESILKKEIELAGYKVIGSWPTLVRFQGDISAIAKMNLRSRVWNKLFLQLAQKNSTDFNQLFDLVATIDWKKYVQGNPIIVTATSKQSLLSSTPTIQSIVKKSIVKNILNGKDGQLPEQHDKTTIEVFVHIERDMCSILLNTTGESLHKRGYKTTTGDAPINEALAAWLLLLSWWKFSEPLYDMFCGSGTIAIEAALIAKNIAPGSFRTFAFQEFSRYDQSLFTTELEKATSKTILYKQHTIIASDIDPKMIAIAQQNAKHAKVDEYITFSTKDIASYLHGPELIGSIVSNPPYGRRLQIFDLEHIYYTLTQLFANHPKLHGGIITTYEDFLKDEKSSVRQKKMFFNGWERCWFYKKTLLK